MSNALKYYWDAETERCHHASATVPPSTVEYVLQRVGQGSTTKTDEDFLRQMLIEAGVLDDE